MKIETLGADAGLVDLTNQPECASMEEGASSIADSWVLSKISQGVRDANRVNVWVNEKYFCSLDVMQVVELGLKVGLVMDAEGLAGLKRAAEFGKLYALALAYVAVRMRSLREMRDYLERKTWDRRVRVQDRRTGEFEMRVRAGYDTGLVEPVMARLVEKGYLDDRKFARMWWEGRHLAKGASRRKLVLELRAKGVDGGLIEELLAESGRDERAELRKMIEKKQARYDDVKLKQYLLRQGFSYGDVVEALGGEDVIY